MKENKSIIEYITKLIPLLSLYFLSLAYIKEQAFYSELNIDFYQYLGLSELIYKNIKYIILPILTLPISFLFGVYNQEIKNNSIVYRLNNSTKLNLISRIKLYFCDLFFMLIFSVVIPLLFIIFYKKLELANFQIVFVFLIGFSPYIIIVLINEIRIKLIPYNYKLNLINTSLVLMFISLSYIFLYYTGITEADKLLKGKKRINLEIEYNENVYNYRIIDATKEFIIYLDTTSNKVVVEPRGKFQRYFYKNKQLENLELVKDKPEILDTTKINIHKKN